jgi:hypothetical protein
MREMLDGKKTYLVAIVLIVYAVAGYLSGHMSLDEAIRNVLDGLGLGFLRAGVQKSGLEG